MNEGQNLTSPGFDSSTGYYSLNTVNAARSKWTQVRDADLTSTHAMAKVQALVDGLAPFSEKARRDSGQAWLSNFNSGEAKAMLDSALQPYADLVTGEKTLVRLKIRWPDVERKQDYEDIMSEEMSEIIRGWPQFYFRYLFIALFMRLHGTGIAYFQDCLNWQWNVTNLAYFKIPRDTPSNEEEIAYAFMKDYMQPHEIAQYINNEEYAVKEGWNIDVLKSVIRTATPPYPDTYNPVEYQMWWKNHDYIQGETAPSVPVIYGWVRENDGTYSLLVFPEGTGGSAPLPKKDGFMCEKRNYFKCAEEAFKFFTNGIGTNGTFHSIRGIGSDMFNAFQQLMRLQNRLMDVAGTGPVLKTTTQEEMETLQFAPSGPFLLVDKSLEVLNVMQPQVQNNLIPAIGELRSTIQKNTGQYTNEGIFSGNRERTRAEIVAGLEENARLSVSGINLFYAQLDRLWQQVVRRWTRPGYMRSDLGGHQVHEWRRRCMERGVPAEALDSVDFARTKAERVLGAGSPAARRAALESIAPLVPQFDARGQNIYLHKAVSAGVGPELAELFVPPTTSAPRPPIDAAIASEQNSTLIKKGLDLMNPTTSTAASLMNVPVMPNENRQIHLQFHTGKIAEFIGMFEEAGQNPDLYAQIVPPLGALYEHAVETLEGYNGVDAPMYKQVLQQSGEILVNGTRHLQKLQEQQMQEAQAAAEQQGAPQQAPQQTEEMRQNIELQRRVIEAQMTLQFLDAKQKQELANMAAKAQQERQIADAKAAADILRRPIS